MWYSRLASNTEIPAQSRDCRGHIFQFSCWPVRKHSFAFLTILSVFITVAEQLCTPWQTFASLLAHYLANTRQRLTELEMCKPQNKNSELLNEGQNRTFTFSLDPAEKKRLMFYCLCINFISQEILCLLFSFISNSELKAGLHLDSTKKVQLFLNCYVYGFLYQVKNPQI